MPDRSELELHAAIWRKAAKVVGGMDYVEAFHRGMTQNMPADGVSHVSYMLPFSKDEQAASKAFGAAAIVLNNIADEYEAAAKAETKEPA